MLGSSPGGQTGHKMQGSPPGPKSIFKAIIELRKEEQENMPENIVGEDGDGLFESKIEISPELHLPEGLEQMVDTSAADYGEESEDHLTAEDAHLQMRM